MGGERGRGNGRISVEWVVWRVINLVSALVVV